MYACPQWMQCVCIYVQYLRTQIALYSYMGDYRSYWIIYGSMVWLYNHNLWLIMVFHVPPLRIPSRHGLLHRLQRHRPSSRTKWPMVAPSPAVRKAVEKKTPVTDMSWYDMSDLVLHGFCMILPCLYLDYLAIVCFLLICGANVPGTENVCDLRACS